MFAFFKKSDKIPVLIVVVSKVLGRQDLLYMLYLFLIFHDQYWFYNQERKS